MKMMLILPLLLSVVPVSAQDPVREERVQFAKGQSSAQLTGEIQGYGSVKYRLSAAAGQQMEVVLKPSNASNYFNVLPPGSEEAIFIGSTLGNRFSGKLPKSGEYVVDVYLMRNAARRNEKSKFTISFKITGGASAAAPGAAGAATATVWPAKHNASGSVKCSSGSLALNKECEFRVVRYHATQSADVWVINADAKSPVRYRLLRFSNKAFTTNDGASLPAERKEDNWLVTCGQEHYFIPDAAIFGG